MLFLLLLPATQALPVPAIINTQETLSPSCDDINNCRTLWNIILGCLTTVFLCTWVAIHPNIPQPINTDNKSAIQKFLHSLGTLFSERIPLFVCMLLVPDYVLAWAVRQWLVATEISKETGWSKTHGFFIIMGGFHLFECTEGRNNYGQGIHPLTEADVRHLFCKEIAADTGTKDDHTAAETKGDKNSASVDTKAKHPAVENQNNHPVIVETKDDKNPATTETKAEHPAVIETKVGRPDVEIQDQFPAVEIKDDENPSTEPKDEEHPSILDTKDETPAVVGTMDGENTVAENPDESPAATETRDKHSARDTKGDENPVVVEIKDEENPAAAKTENEYPAVEPKDENPTVNTKNDEDPVAAETKVRRPAVVEIQDRFPAEEEIQDKSKNDWLAKALVIIQTLWFVTQCIARGFARLPVTKLELVTLAYTTMNLGIYLAWWHKPYDVARPIRVFTTLPRAIGTGTTRRLYYWADANSELERTAELAGNYLIGSQDKFTDIHRAKKVPAFYSGDPDDRKIFIADAITLLAGVVFGAIHLIGWSFEFSSYTELLLWRLSSVTIIGVPLLFTAVGGIQTRFRPKISHFKRYISSLMINNLLNVLANGIAALLAILYIASRITTLALAFTTLRSLPPGAYTVVAWTSFIPHI